MKASEMRELNMEDLQAELENLKAELFRLRFQHATKQLENPLQLKSVKRNIARVKTIMKEYEMEGANV